MRTKIVGWIQETDQVLCNRRWVVDGEEARTAQMGWLYGWCSWQRVLVCIGAEAMAEGKTR